MIDTIQFSRYTINKEVRIPKGIILENNGFFHGKIKNIQFKGVMRNGHTTFIEVYGSIPKFVLDENLTNMKHSSFEKAIKLLSNRFGVDFNDFPISRLDVAYNVSLKHPIGDYLFLMYDYPKKGKEIWQSSVYFKGGTTLCFYDKKREIKDKRKKYIISNEKLEKHENVLRYELRLPSSTIRKKLKLHKGELLTLKKILEPKNYNRIIHLWYKSFTNIRMGKIPVELTPKMQTVKDFQISFMKIAIRHIGYDNVKHLIDTKFIGDQNMKNKGYRLRKYIRAIMLTDNSIESDLLKDESIRKLRKARNKSLMK
jgi:hypothetical protein